MSWVNRRTYGWMDRIIAVSEDIAAKLREIGVDEEKIRIVYNGVDERFQPRDRLEMRRALQLPDDRFFLLFVGLLAPVKGLLVLLEALHSMQSERPFLALVGEGPVEEEMRERLARDGAEEQVLFAGAQPSSEIPKWLNAADALVLASFSEGRPNVVLEAQACGVPVVATRVGGTTELICDAETGLLVESGNAAGLADALRKLTADEALRRRLGEAGRRSIHEKGLTWEASSQQVQAIYRELLEA